MGGESGGGGSGGGMSDQGGFGGLGIGNPGSYGGQQSVGAPGGTGGASVSGGWGGYSAAQMAQAMAQSDAQAKQNNAESALAGMGYGSDEIGTIMNNINNLSTDEAEKAHSYLADTAIKEDFKERDFLDKLSTLYTQNKVGGDLGLYGHAIGEYAAESLLGFSAGKIGSAVAGPFGSKLGKMLGKYAAEKARDNFIGNVSKYGVDKAREMAEAERSLQSTDQPGSESHGIIPGLSGNYAGGDYMANPSQIQLTSANEGIRSQQEMLDIYNELFAPYRELGVQMLPQYRAMTTGGQYQSPMSPQYGLEVERGSKGINRALASRGLFNSSARGEALSDLFLGAGQNEASRQYGRLLDVQRLGTGAIGQLGAAGSSAGANVSSIYGNTGSALNQLLQNRGLQNQQNYNMGAEALSGLGQFAAYNF